MGGMKINGNIKNYFDICRGEKIPYSHMIQLMKDRFNISEKEAINYISHLI